MSKTDRGSSVKTILSVEVYLLPGDADICSAALS